MAWHDGLDRNSPTFAIAADNRTPIHVLAGPGTGKSFALKRRVARLLEEEEDPRSILAVTFTRTAARDLLDDLQSLGVPGCEMVRACTLHSLCFSILNDQEVFHVINRSPRLIMEFEVTPLLRDVNHPGFGDMKERRKRLEAFEAAWARLQHEDPGWPLDPVDRTFGASLNDWLLFHECMLVGELVPLALTYLRTNPLAPIRARFRHVLVDEYQDLNKADQVTTDLLADNAHVLVVGDNDQCVYSFRYAHPDGITEYPTIRADTVSTTLTDCHRCGCRIVQVANHFITQGRDRPNRRLVEMPEKGDGEIHILQWPSVRREAAGIAHAISVYLQSEITTPDQILILAPRRIVGYAIRDELQALGIEACSYFTEDTLDADLAKERFELLALLANPQDRVAFRHLLGVGSQDCRAGAYSRIRAYCERAGQSPIEVLEGLDDGTIEMSYTNHLVERYRQIKATIAELRVTQLADFANVWLGNSEATSDLATLVQQVLADERSRPWQILQEWIDGPVGDNPLFVQALHEELRTRISQPEIPSDRAVVKVMSLHKSKGLTADIVVVAGCIEGLIPRIDDRAPLEEQREKREEQRRLFYVALTRARQTLILSSATNMDIRDALRTGARLASGTHVQGSRFLGELGPSAPAALSGTEFLRQLDNQR